MGNGFLDLLIDWITGCSKLQVIYRDSIWGVSYVDFSDIDFISIVKAKLLLFLLIEMAYWTWVMAAIVAGHFLFRKIFHGKL